jgi:hypothetical protein
MSVTVNIVLSYAEVVTAIKKGEKVTLLREDGTKIIGTLRNLTPAEGSAYHLPAGGDLRTAWVWITTISGFETWIKFTELVELRENGAVAWHIYSS